MGAKRDLRTMFLRLILVTVYGIFGAAVFYAIEHDGGYGEELERKKTLFNSTKHDIMQRLGINYTEFNTLVSKINDATSHTPLEWSFSRGIDLSWQAMTTIGYGNKTPVTAAARLFFIPFALFGIPLTAFMLNTVGENICHLICYIITRIEKNILRREEVKSVCTKSLVVNIVLAFGLILMMAGVSIHYDEWTFIDGLYVWFVTFTTIGFGDFIPGAAADDTGGIVVVLYRVVFVVIGLSLLSTIINAMGDLAESRRKAPQLKSCASCFCFQNCLPEQENSAVHEMEEKEAGSRSNNGKENVEMQHYV